MLLLTLSLIAVIFFLHPYTPEIINACSSMFTALLAVVTSVLLQSHLAVVAAYTVAFLAVLNHLQLLARHHRILASPQQ